MAQARITQGKLAKGLGIKQPSVSAFLQSEASVWKYTPAAARATGVRQEWLERGVGAMVEPDAVESSLSSTTAVTDTAPGLVPELDLRAGAGGGGLAVAFSDSEGDGRISDEVTKGQWMLPADYMRELDVRPAQAFVVEVKGDSMSPTFESGDRVMVDMSDRRPSPPGVFALYDGIGLVVKRIEPIFPSEPMRYRVVSDNEHHSPYEVLEEEARIVGRVVWRAMRV